MNLFRNDPYVGLPYGVTERGGGGGGGGAGASGVGKKQVRYRFSPTGRRKSIGFFCEGHSEELISSLGRYFINLKPAQMGKENEDVESWDDETGKPLLKMPSRFLAGALIGPRTASYRVVQVLASSQASSASLNHCE